MSSEKDMISIDQLFADKLNEGIVDIDPSVAWAQFEVSSSGAAAVSAKGAWTLSKIIPLLSIVTLATIGVLFLSQGNKANGDDNIFDQTSPAINNELHSQKNSNENDISIINIESTTKEVLSTEEVIKENTKTIQQETVKSTSQSTKSIQDGSGIQTTQSCQAVKTPSSYKSQNLFSKNTNNQSLEINLESKLANQLFDRTTTTATKSTLNSGPQLPISSLIDQQDSRSDELQRVTRTLKDLVMPSSLPSLNSYLHYESKFDRWPSFIEPRPVSKSNKRWYVDLGVSLSKAYRLTEDLSLDQSESQPRLTYLAFGRTHLSFKRLDTRFQLSYHKIHGVEDFVGERIVRTYSDDNFTAGYNMNVKLSDIIEAELGGGIGISFIDKTEYEQEPFFVNGARQYRDYTLSNFKIDPLASYQATFKIIFSTPINLDVFGGATYRSQFANQLSSSQTTRENTLGKFADLQFVIGLRYNLNNH